MNTKVGQISFFHGAQVENVAEAACIRKLKRDLAARGIDAVLLANLTVGPKRRQVDLIVATHANAVVVEIKGYVHAVQGGVNGPWRLELGDGKVKPLDFHNPYEQALTNRYTVTDQLATLFGISSNTARYAVAGMLCIHPKPVIGSRIPKSDFKLTLGGYDELLRIVTTVCPEALSLDHWRQLARHLDLYDSSMVQPTEAETTIDQYLTAYNDLARVMSGPYIDPLFEQADTTAALSQRITAGAQAQIIGASGSGKTELMKALARSTAQRGCLPVLVRAEDFERQLAPLLQAAIARHSPLRPLELFKAAANSGAEIILFVDGLNECHAARRNELISALHAARIKYGTRLVLSAQEPISLPAILSGETIRILQPDNIQSQRLVSIHLGRKLTDNERKATEVIATAHDALVLATVLGTPASIDGRFTLYHSFIEKRLDTANVIEVARSLAILATTMRTSFVSSLPVAAAARLLNSTRPTTMKIAHAAGLVQIQNNRLTFRHDLIADFFAADDILNSVASPAKLGAIARQPINAELREFLLGGCATTAEIEALIGHMPDPRLLRSALSGNAGNKPHSYIVGRLRDLIGLLKQTYSKVSLALPEGVSSARDLHSLIPSLPDGLDNGTIDNVYLGLISYALNDGLLPDLLDLFASVDRRLVSEAQRLQNAHPDLRIAWQAATYGSIYGYHSGAGDLQSLLQEIQNRWFKEADSATVLHLNSYLDNFESLSPGQIFLLVSALNAGRNVDPLPSRFPELLQHIWSLRIYHLRLCICHIIRFRGTELPEEQREKVAESLQDWMSNDNIFLNSIIFDALEGVNGIEIALTIEDAIEEYEAMLSLPDDTVEARSLAVSAVTSTYDHPYRDVYWEAFYNVLPVEKRQTLLLRGLSDEQQDPWHIDDILRALLQEPTVAAAPELQKLAQIPIIDSHSPQLAINVYANSITLLAKLAIPLAPIDPPPDDPARRAWYRAARLIHALNADPTVVECKMSAEVEILRACGIAETFDVIQRLAREKHVMLRPANVEFENAWPNLVLELCRAALSPSYAPISIFERFYTSQTLADDHIEMALILLEKTGRATDIGLVTTWLNHPIHGERALQTARALEQRSQ